MLNYLKNTANKNFTENRAVTYKSTYSDCLDLFSTIGAIRFHSDEEISTRFMRAYTENPDLAMKILFFGRDVRGGLGERKVFRTIIKWLAFNYPDSVNKNIGFIAEYGRFDDLLALFDTPCEEMALKAIASQFNADMAALKKGEDVSLLGKWLPSVNASNAQTVKDAKTVARFLKLSDADYRKALTKLRAKIKIIENNLREKDYSFDYSKQPSRAMLKYRAAFMRNDSDRYSEFINRVATGQTTVNTGALTPYDIVNPVMDRYYGGVQTITTQERKTLDATWNSLENFTTDENALVVVDGSGSMYMDIKPSPIAVAVSLAIYFAERNKGGFRNHFITFSHNPQLVEIKGSDIYEKVRYCSSFNEVANTDLEKVFMLILKTAVENKLPQSDLPEKLYIISDMEFDYCVNNAGLTNFENAKMLFESYGYKLPQVVFWNVASRNRQQPVTQHENGVALVSGTSPRIFSMLSNNIITPYECMMDIIGSERYEKIAA